VASAVVGLGNLFGQGLDCDGMAQGSKHPQGKSNAMLLAGVVGILGGIFLLGYGLAPAKDLWEAVGPAFSGGTPPDDLSDRLDASMADLKGRVLIDAFGFLALLAGIVLAKQAFAKPKSKPVEQLVQEEVARRLAAQPPAAHGTQSLPLTVAVASPSAGAGPAPVPAPAVAAPAQPRSAVPAPTPASTRPAPRRTHCIACGSVLVAGGRICPSGHPQA
jgi:hypothetical protein